MTFKVLGQLTNVRSPKDDKPVLTTTPSKGIIKLSASGAARMGFAVEDFVTIIKAETEKGIGLFVTAGHPSSEAEGDQPAVAQLGSKLSPSTAGVKGGTLQFSSENAWRELGGNREKRRIFNIAEEPVVEGGAKYWEVTFDHEEDKQVRETGEEGAE